MWSKKVETTSCDFYAGGMGESCERQLSPALTVHDDGAQGDGNGEHGGHAEGGHGDGVTASAAHDPPPRRALLPDPRHDDTLLSPLATSLVPSLLR